MVPYDVRVIGERRVREGTHVRVRRGTGGARGPAVRREVAAREVERASCDGAHRSRSGPEIPEVGQSTGRSGSESEIAVPLTDHGVLR